MRTHFILFSILLGIIFVSISSAETNTTLINGKKPLNSEIINGVNYMSLDALAATIFPKSKFDVSSGSIKYNSTEIKCAVGSFYVLLKNNSEMKVAQMSLPAIEMNNTMTIPLESFIMALSSLELIKFDKTSTGYFIELESPATRAETENKTDEEMNADLPEKTIVKQSTVNIEVRKPLPTNSEKKAATKVKAKNIETMTKDEPIKVVPETDTYKPIPEGYNPEIPVNKYHIPAALDRSSILKKNN